MVKPKSVPTVINGLTFDLDRGERANVMMLRHSLHVEGRKTAEALWLEWAQATRQPAIQIRRMAVGRALGLGDDHDEEEERQRYARLWACAMHVFKPSVMAWKAAGRPDRLTCAMCLQWMPLMEASAYARGFAAAGGDAEAVIEGFGH
jgi:hypothetical protein